MSPSHWNKDIGGIDHRRCLSFLFVSINRLYTWIVHSSFFGTKSWHNFLLMNKNVYQRNISGGDKCKIIEHYVCHFLELHCVRYFTNENNLFSRNLKFEYLIVIKLKNTTTVENSPIQSKIVDRGDTPNTQIRDRHTAWHGTELWFLRGFPLSSVNQVDHHDFNKHCSSTNYLPLFVWTHSAILNLIFKPRHFFYSKCLCHVRQYDGHVLHLAACSFLAYLIKSTLIDNDWGQRFVTAVSDGHCFSHWIIWQTLFKHQLFTIICLKTFGYFEFNF
jgi:hypothetical protein